MLSLAYADDLLSTAVEEFLVSGRIAKLAGRHLSPIVGCIREIRSVSSVDLPQLLLDGAFDLAITTTDRMAEADLLEDVERVSKGLSRRTPPAGEPLPIVSPGSLPRLVWGFAADGSIQESAPFSVEATLLERARYGSAFTPNRDPGGRVVCVTSHVELAKRELRRLEVKGEVRHYPDPWRVIASAPPAFCCLAVWDGREPAPEGVSIGWDSPVSVVAPLLVQNPIAAISRGKRVAMGQARNIFRRASLTASLVVVSVRCSLEQVPDFASHPDVVHSSAFTGRGAQGEHVELRCWVRREHAPRFMDWVHGVGADEVVQLRTISMDLGIDIVGPTTAN